MVTTDSTRRVSVSLPSDVVDHLDFVSSRMGCSRSALLSALLTEALPPLRQIASCLPPKGEEVTGVHAQRFRGEAARALGDQVARLLSGGQGDLLDG